MSVGTTDLNMAQLLTRSTQIPTPRSPLPRCPLPYTKCLAFSPKSQDMPKGKKKHSEETKQSSEPDTDMTQLLELSHYIHVHYLPQSTECPVCARGHFQNGLNKVCTLSVHSNRRDRA